MYLKAGHPPPRPVAHPVKHPPSKPPAQRPEVGLSEGAELHGNPVRLAYAGVLQLLYELRHNKDWRTRLKILLGSSDWQPPISKDFALA